ncbi:MAG TPA: hypothetical protein PKD37_00140 [Oligoflexia bacterium]|nr:hypothetical protein [Oligoflexia bacterium]
MKNLSRKKVGMFYKLAFYLCFLAVLQSLFACGGGGGEGDGDGGGAPNGGGGKDAAIGARILHGSLSAPPVELYSSLKSGPLGKGLFGGNAPHFGLASAPQVLSLAITRDANAVFASHTVDLSVQPRISLLIFGNSKVGGTQTAVFENISKIAVPQGSDQASLSGIRVVHAAFGAARITLQVAGAEQSLGASYGGVSEYLLVPSGATTITAFRASDRFKIGERLVELAPARNHTVLVGGEVDFFSFVKMYPD